MRVVAEDLHCTAVRITGGDPDRIETTARYAVERGLEVWFSPFPCELSNAEMLPLFTDCAERAERLRRDGAEVVLVTGCELSVFARGYLPGDTLNERIPVLAGPGREAALQGIPDKVNAFLGEAVDAVRPLFGGRVSYASCGMGCGHLREVQLLEPRIVPLRRASVITSFYRGDSGRGRLRLPATRARDRA
ncbi:hypothetical protein AB0D83_18750 [Streptomyces decoyicus]|uniref:hypothetical protein n=1 Tax=Streptomyces decoyicus TaxID=249567 RepID=UPI0034062D83